MLLFTPSVTMSIMYHNGTWVFMTTRDGPSKRFSSFKRLRHYLRIMLHDMFDRSVFIHTIYVPVLMTIEGPYDTRWHDGNLEIAPYWREDTGLIRSND